MAITCVAGRLPAEIVSMFMDCADVPDLITLSHVCTRWNAIARAHPDFWGRIRLLSVSATAVDFFLARLDSGLDRPVSISLRLPDPEAFCDRLRYVILPAITRGLHRVVSLEISLDADAAPDALAALSLPAPLLEKLALDFVNSDKAQTFPPGIFLNQCPQLRRLSITGLEIPSVKYPALQSVQNLWLNFDGAFALSAGLFNQFPALQNLNVLGSLCTGVEDIDGTATAMIIPSLVQLALRFTNSDYLPLLSSVRNLKSLPHILCREPDESVLQQLLGHLGDDALELGFRYLNYHTVHVILVAQASRHARTFVECAPFTFSSMPYGALLTPEFLRRVVLLRLVAAPIADVAPRAPIALPQCTTLELVLREGEGLLSADVGVPLRLPTLRVVVISRGGRRDTPRVAVDAALLHLFLSQLLGAHRSRPALRFHGVRLTGDRERLLRDFSEVATAPYDVTFPHGMLPGALRSSLF